MAALARVPNAPFVAICQTRNFMAEAPDFFQATLNLTRGERGAFISLCHEVPLY